MDELKQYTIELKHATTNIALEFKIYSTRENARSSNINQHSVKITSIAVRCSQKHLSCHEKIEL